MRFAPVSLRAALSGASLAFALAPAGACSDGDSVAPVLLQPGGAGGGGGSGGGAGGGGAPLDLSAPATRARLGATLDELAALGPKRAGTPKGLEAGEHLKRRLEGAGVEGVTFEGFSFSQHELVASSLGVTIDGANVPMAHDAFAYSGAGRVEAEVVYVGSGRPEDYEGKSVEGKIAFVTRDPIFHRQAQYAQAAARSAAGLLYASQSPQNLIQIGTITDPEDGMARMPTLTVGKDDGDKVRRALEAGKPVRAELSVDASVHPARGRNVVARLPGTDPSGAYLLVGAHYDTWQIGSTDNGTGVAALVEIATRLAAAPSKRRLGVMLVGFDAEELGLFGSYDYLRKHVIVAQEPMLAYLNLEMPAGGPPSGLLRAVASAGAPVAAACDEAGISNLYVPAGLELVPELFGGLIPTDVQGMYWHGLQGLTTYCETDYYHTTADTPDKVDIGFLAESVNALTGTLGALDDEPVQSFRTLDDELWAPDVDATPSPDGGLDVTVVAKGAAGDLQPDAVVRVWVDVDDFTRSFDQTTGADAQGRAAVRVPPGALTQGQGARWLHVTAGKTYPLAERIRPLP